MSHNEQTFIPGGGGGEPTEIYFAVTKAAADTLVSGNDLVPGALYKITDRGDRGIFLRAISVNQFAPDGTRLMLVPATYENGGTVGGHVWRSIWRSGLNPDADDLVIWNAHVYKNLTGNIGTAPDGDAVNWELVPKASFAAGEYVEKFFGVIYDWDNDWISEQWDDKGNRVRSDLFFNYYWLYGEATNIYIDETDWNYVEHLNPTDGISAFSHNTVTAGIKNNIQSDGSLVAIVLNQAESIINNQTSNIVDNIAVASIRDNVVSGTITGNRVGGIIQSNVGGSIYYNTAKGGISDNTYLNISHNVLLGASGSINNNTTSQEISYNVAPDGITSNSNNGIISHNNVRTITSNSNSGDIIDNTLGILGGIAGNANTGKISGNRNKGNIENNTSAVTDIENNSNIGLITFNSNVGSIAYNTNSGNIGGVLLADGNSNNGAINHNKNRGNIASNTNAGLISENVNNGLIEGNTGTGRIYNNSNNGAIATNSCIDIQFNHNNGRISSNTHDGDIEYNNNGGNIINCVGAGGFSVFRNNNNGDIDNPAGLAAADITDTQVDK